MYLWPLAGLRCFNWLDIVSTALIKCRANVETLLCLVLDTSKWQLVVNILFLYIIINPSDVPLLRIFSEQVYATVLCHAGSMRIGGLTWNRPLYAETQIHSGIQTPNCYQCLEAATCDYVQLPLSDTATTLLCDVIGLLRSLFQLDHGWFF